MPCGPGPTWTSFCEKKNFLAVRGRCPDLASDFGPRKTYMPTPYMPARSSHSGSKSKRRRGCARQGSYRHRGACAMQDVHHRHDGLLHAHTGQADPIPAGWMGWLRSQELAGNQRGGGRCRVCDVFHAAATGSEYPVRAPGPRRVGHKTTDGAGATVCNVTSCSVSSMSNPNDSVHRHKITSIMS